VVVDRLRIFLNRPLRDSDRPRLFALAVAVIAAVAAAFALLDDAGSTPTVAPPERPAAAAPPPAASAPPAPPAQDPPPPATRADIATLKRAASRFLEGYLPYTYGAPPRIAGASAELRRRLARERPRVPPAERRRRPRVEHLQAEGASRRRADVAALVSDGTRRYTVLLELSRTADRWRVIDVGS
jgi:hypothetical protein